jgi:dephospho-CoA kinase/inosine/xanthosine triphosphate pyrophosphatase family protein
MYRLAFFTSNQAKLANIHHLVKDYVIDVYSLHKKTYRANYFEPRLNDHKKLLKESFMDALKRWKKVNKSDLELHTFFIEDTSVILHGLSSKKDIPGPDVKYWMQEVDFKKIDKLLKNRGDDRRVTVRSDILLYLPKTLRQEMGKKFIHFTSQVNGYFVIKEYFFSTNALYPWLDNKTFNKWFSPYSSGKPISMLPINEADKFDFRKANVEQMLAILNISKKHVDNLGFTKQLSLNFNEKPPVFILCGPTCTGKTTLAEYLSEKYGFSHVEASDFMYLAFYQRHSPKSSIEIVDFAKQALKDIPDIVASQVLNYIVDKSSLSFVISGFRNIQEIEYFKNNYLQSPVIPIYINSNTDTRFDRCMERGREDLKKDKILFNEIDQKQLQMGLSELRDKLDCVIENNGSFEAFQLLFEVMFNNDLNGMKIIINKKDKTSLGLEEWILLSLLGEYNSLKYFTTTEISKLINKILPTGLKSKEKDNVSRYFNQTYRPFYEIHFNGRFNEYRLSDTGYSFAKQVKLKLIE